MTDLIFWTIRNKKTKRIYMFKEHWDVGPLLFNSKKRAEECLQPSTDEPIRVKMAIIPDSDGVEATVFTKKEHYDYD
jgi:hypothetical protein